MLRRLVFKVFLHQDNVQIHYSYARFSFSVGYQILKDLQPVFVFIFHPFARPVACELTVLVFFHFSLACKQIELFIYTQLIRMPLSVRMDEK